jgi:hypothetical protein
MMTGRSMAESEDGDDELNSMRRRRLCMRLWHRFVATCFELHQSTFIALRSFLPASTKTIEGGERKGKREEETISESTK